MAASLRAERGSGAGKLSGSGATASQRARATSGHRRCPIFYRSGQPSWSVSICCNLSPASPGCLLPLLWAIGEDTDLNTRQRTRLTSAEFLSSGAGSPERGLRERLELHLHPRPVAPGKLLYPGANSASLTRKRRPT